MALSIQTNVNSLSAQENLRVNTDFQARTIQRLTSGYRINSSGDDAAGLAVANKFRSDTAELTQGVRNANDGLSQLQIIDGGVNNISKILDRMKSLATQSASDTYTGGDAGRNIMDKEYQNLSTELTRQANNVGLGSGAVGGRYNANINVYVGGGMGVQANAQVSIDLSGSASKIDATGLGLAATKLGGSNGVAVGNVDIRNATTLYNTNATQVFNFDVDGGQRVQATVTGTAAGITGQATVDQLNSQLGKEGITASLNATTGFLEFSSSKGFLATVTGAAATAATVTVTNQANTSLNTKTFTIAGPTENQTLTFKVGGSTVATVALVNLDSTAVVTAKIRGALTGTAIEFANNGTGGAFLSASGFTVESSGATAGKEAITNVDGTANDINSASSNADISSIAPPALAGTGAANAKLALTALTAAVTSLSTLTGKVGTAQNMLGYAINLAQSQITNFSAAESRIRDTDVASEAANLTKAQVLSQASMAAMAQANSAPQAVLALLRG